MSTNPLKADLNRANQIKAAPGDVKQSVTLFDIDYAMITYLEDTVLPQLDDNGTILKIPVIYGNSERWKGARRDGIFRDNKGKVQLPLLMIRRTSIAKDESMSMLNRHVSYQGVTKYSKDNRYDRFNLLGKSVTPKYEIYKITMPDYVEVNYDCMCWTSYTEQLNQVIEQLNFASSYWGDKDRFKFRTSVGEFNVINEVGEGTERINRVEFSLNVKAYLLPEKFDGETPIKKYMSTKRVVVATETDVTANGRLEGLLTTPSPYYDNKDLIDFLSLNNSKSKKIISGDINTEYPGKVGKQTITFSGIKLIKTPPQLTSVVSGGITIVDETYDVKVYINGVRYYQTSHFTVSLGLYIHFDSTLLGFNISNGDEIVITGKFIEILP
jgi:hypothetical protein